MNFTSCTLSHSSNLLKRRRRRRTEWKKKPSRPRKKNRKRNKKNTQKKYISILCSYLIWYLMLFSHSSASFVVVSFFFPSLLSNALRYFSLQPNESEILDRIRCIVYLCSNDDPSFHHSYCIFKLKFNLCTFNSLVLTHEYCYITCLKTFIHIKPFRATMKIKKK